MENRTEPEPEMPASDLQPLFSLIAGEGDGFLLGVAAGDTAGSAWDLGYSAVTEQVTVIAYDLIEHRSIDADRLRGSILELAGVDGEDPVYRAETPGFRSWLESSRSGQPEISDTPNIDGAARATAVGVAFRKDPEEVVDQTVELGRIFDRHAWSLAAYLIGATATAASCYAQSGRDLVAGVAEAVGSAVVGLKGLPGGEGIQDLGGRIGQLIPSVGVTDADEALAAVDGDPAEPLHPLLASLLLAAPVNERFHVAVEQSARIGGSNLGAFAGAIVGARLGIKGWPWAFANDTWFAEIGRRLVRGPDQVADLPIPYAVEHHLMYGPGRGFR